MDLITLKNAYVTQTQTKGINKPIALQGCIYDEDYLKVELSERYSGHKGDYYQNANPQKITPETFELADEIAGRSVYLGHMMNHYGHFITETISTFWLLMEDNSFDNYIFQSFEGSDSIPEFATLILQAFNIPVSKVIVIEKHSKLTEVTIPQRLVKLNFQIAPQMSKVFQHIKTYTLNNFPEKTNNQALIYLSRLENSKNKKNRIILNEAYVEATFRSIGFEIVYLEKMSFSEQLHIINNAKTIIGFSGTALHNCVFAQQQTKVIELADIRSGQLPHAMQALCYELSNIHFKFIPFKGKILNKDLSIGFVALSELKKHTQSLQKQTQSFPINNSTKLNPFFQTTRLTVTALVSIVKHFICDKLRKLNH